MPKAWDHETGRVVAADGRRGGLPYLLGVEQADRWVAAGFDVGAALDRKARLAAEFHAAPDYRSAHKVLRNFYRAERELVLASGVGADDPDLWRIEAALKDYVWEPAAA